jgi:dolichyl-diphosphooligosaccharide--protein glycosyltransferase
MTKRKRAVRGAGAAASAPVSRQLRIPWFLTALAAYLVSVGLRLLDLPSWSSPAMRLEGDPILSNPDSYAWLAGALGVNHYAGSFLAGVVKVLHAAGVSMIRTGYWLPVLVAPLVVFPVAWLGRRWNLGEGIPTAAVAGASSFAYLYRTRLGWLDTDMVALLLPVLLAAGAMVWMQPYLRSPWGEGSLPGPRGLAAWGGGLGLLAAFHGWVYPSGEPLGMAVLGTALTVALFLSAREGRCDLILGGGVVLLAGYGGRAGLLAGTAAAALVLLTGRAPRGPRERLAAGVAMAAALAVIFPVRGKVHDLIFHLGRYGTLGTTPQGARMPSVIENVGESIDIPLDTAVGIIAGNWPLLLLSLAGLAWLLRRRPLAASLLPLLAIGFSSVTLGWRFALYGGVAVGVGLGYGLALLLRERGSGTRVRWGAQAVLFLVVTLAVARLAWREPPYFFLPRADARALAELGRTAEPNSRIWIWWDFAYAAQFYAGRPTFADGSRNRGEYVVPLARVLGGDSPRTAAAIMAWAGERAARKGDSPWYNPFQGEFDRGGGAGSQSLLASMAEWRPGDAGAIPPQYLVVSRGNLPVSGAIASLATWNLADGSSRNLRSRLLQGRRRLEPEKGILHLEGGTVRLRYLDLVAGSAEEGTVRDRREWADNGDGMAVVDLQTAGVTYLMDQEVHRSLMVQMLLADPALFEPWFHLVLDHAPLARVYRLDPAALIQPPPTAPIAGAGSPGPAPPPGQPGGGSGPPPAR